MARLFLLNHPDSEPEYSKRKMGSVNILPWNTRNVHWRKFIQRTGEYLHNGIPLSADLCFWAEYEPYSKATIISKTTPKAIHTDLQPVHGCLQDRNMPLIQILIYMDAFVIYVAGGRQNTKKAIF